MRSVILIVSGFMTYFIFNHFLTLKLWEELALLALVVAIIWPIDRYFLNKRQKQTK